MSYFVVQLEGPSELVLGGGDGGAVCGEQELAEVNEAVPVAVEGGEDELGHDVAVVLGQHRRQHRGNLGVFSNVHQYTVQYTQYSEIKGEY